MISARSPGRRVGWSCSEMTSSPPRMRWTRASSSSLTATRRLGTRPISGGKANSSKSTPGSRYWYERYPYGGVPLVCTVCSLIRRARGRDAAASRSARLVRRRSVHLERTGGHGRERQAPLGEDLVVGAARLQLLQTRDQGGGEAGALRGAHGEGRAPARNVRSAADQQRVVGTAGLLRGVAVGGRVGQDAADLPAAGGHR